MAKTLLSTAGSVGSNPGQGANILHALRSKNQAWSMYVTMEQYGNKFNKTLKMAHIQKKSESSHNLFLAHIFYFM